MIPAPSKAHRNHAYVETAQNNCRISALSYAENVLPIILCDAFFGIPKTITVAYYRFIFLYRISQKFLT